MSIQSKLNDMKELHRVNHIIDRYNAYQAFENDRLDKILSKDSNRFSAEAAQILESMKKNEERYYRSIRKKKILEEKLNGVNQVDKLNELMLECDLIIKIKGLHYIRCKKIKVVCINDTYCIYGFKHLKDIIAEDSRLFIRKLEILNEILNSIKVAGLIIVHSNKSKEEMTNELLGEVQGDMLEEVVDFICEYTVK